MTTQTAETTPGRLLDAEEAGRQGFWGVEPYASMLADLLDRRNLPDRGVSLGEARLLMRRAYPGGIWMGATTPAEAARGAD